MKNQNKETDAVKYKVEFELSNEDAKIFDYLVYLAKCGRAETVSRCIRVAIIAIENLPTETSSNYMWQ